MMLFGSKACQLQLTDWGEFDGGSFNLSGFDTVEVYGFDVGPTSSINSSITASTHSLPNNGMKPSNSHGKDLELSTSSPPMETSIVCDGPLIGKPTFESNTGGSSVKLPSYFMNPVSSVSATKKIKSSSQNALIPCCQVDDCNLDLSSAKEYHQKHRVCRSHSKSPKVIVRGIQRRFCQQCSRFHSLSDFDENKRSCRTRLSDHNARRRKPQQETIQFNSTRLSSWFYDNRQSMNLVFNKRPLVHSKTTADSTWETSEVSQFTITGGLTLKPYKADSINGQSLVGAIKLSETTGMQTNASNLYSVSNDMTAEVFSQGVKETMFSLNMGVSPELPRALSLLSNKSLDEPEFISVDHSTHVSHISIPEQVMHAIPQSLPFESIEHWQAEQHLFSPRIHTLAANDHSGGNFQEIQLSKDPLDDSYVNGLN